MTTTAIEKAQVALRAKREAGEKIEFLSWSEKAKRNPGSRKFAIHAFCEHCMGGPGEKNVRQSIAECTAPGCPLYGHRPYR